MDLSKEEIKDIFQPGKQFEFHSTTKNMPLGEITVIEWIRTGEKETGEYCRMEFRHKNGLANYRYEYQTLHDYLQRGVFKLI